ncbi:MAG TPA: hypothetical protein VK658_18605 [Chryseolinea sp.]|nr:hypothetical protein [Chryseolinea sp.]
MFKHALPVVFLFVSLATFAQSNKEDVDLIQSIYGKEKKDVVAQFIKLEGAQKDAFWKLYDEYETKRKALGQQRVALLERYAKNYTTLDDPTTDKLTTDMMKLGASTDKLITTYYKKMKKASTVKAAAQFVQIESYLLSEVRASIFESIPIIDELK